MSIAQQTEYLKKIQYGLNGLAVAMDTTNEIENIYKFGRNPVGGVTLQPIWDGVTAYHWLTSAVKLQIVSDDAKDTMTSGTGAWEVTIQGLGSDWTEISETVKLNGLTAVETNATFIRVYRAKVISGGTDKTNMGAISIYETGESTHEVAKIIEENGQTLMSIYTVPACCTGYITQVTASTQKGKSVVADIRTRENITGNECWQVKGVRDLYQNSFSIGYKVPRKIEAKTDIMMMSIGDATTPISSTFEIALFRD